MSRLTLHDPKVNDEAPASNSRGREFERCPFPGCEIVVERAGRLCSRHNSPEKRRAAAVRREALAG